MSLFIKEKLKLWRLPQIEMFYGKMEFLPLWPTYIGEKGRTLGKTYGIKARCNWEHIGNLGNMLGICWEPIEHLEGTGWEQRENEKKSSFTSPKT
jgi:hypothetical protein